MHDALGRARGARGIEDIKGIGGRHGNAVGGLRRGHDGVPVVVSAGDQGGLFLGTLHDDAGLGLVPRQLDGAVEERFVGDDAIDFYAARGGDDDTRLGVVDAPRQFARGEAAEHHRMHRPQARRRQHGNDGLGHHGHIDHDTVARADAEA